MTLVEQHMNLENYRQEEYPDKYCAKCPKISYTKIAVKMAYANSAVPDQTAPGGAV